MSNYDDLYKRFGDTYGMSYRECSIDEPKVSRLHSGSGQAAASARTRASRTLDKAKAFFEGKGRPQILGSRVADIRLDPGRRRLAKRDTEDGHTGKHIRVVTPAFSAEQRRSG